MATRFCPSCAGEFIAGVDACPDCDVALVDEMPEAGPGSSTMRDGHVEYELASWAAESRLMLEQLLEAEDIPRVWEAGNLVVPAYFEIRVDALVEQVEVTTLPTLDPDLPKVAYDIDDWSDEQQTDLMAELEEAGIAYEFDQEGALVVLEENEQQVEDILDAIEFPDALPVDDDWDDEDDATPGDADADGNAADDEGDDGEAEEDGEDEGDEEGEEGEGEGDDGDDGDDGLEASEVMSDLFVAADRLMHNARDPEGVLSLVDRAADAGELPLPYGFNRAVWGDIVAQADGLKVLLEDDDSTDEQIEEQARVLRDALRTYV